MTCDQAAELLPWLLNGTLDPEERQGVLEHVRGCAACRRALAETRSALAAAGAHLPAEALAAGAFAEPLPEGIDAALVEEHLAACPQCAADLELARTSRALADEDVLLFPSAGAAEPARPAAAPARRWRAAALAAGLAAILFAGGWLTTRRALETMEDRLAAGAAPPPPAAPGRPAPAEDKRLARLAAENRRLREAAAGRDAAERAAREETEALRRQLAQREPAAGGGPQLNPLVEDLMPPGQDVLRGGGETGKRIQLPASAGGVTLILNLAEPSPFREHAVELRDAAGKQVWSARGLLERDLTFTLHLPRPALGKGAYTLDVYGLDGARREKVQSYRFTIE